MCLLIVWLNPENTEEACHQAGLGANPYSLHEYSLVLASNRDERYDRPSLPSQFARSQDDEIKDDILGGWDATPGKEGGTWLGGIQLHLQMKCIWVWTSGVRHIVFHENLIWREK